MYNQRGECPYSLAWLMYCSKSGQINIDFTCRISSLFYLTGFFYLEHIHTVYSHFLLLITFPFSFFLGINTWFPDSCFDPLLLHWIVYCENITFTGWSSWLTVWYPSLSASRGATVLADVGTSWHCLAQGHSTNCCPVYAWTVAMDR